MNKLIIFIALISISVLGLACGAGSAPASAGKTVKSATVNNLTVTLSNSDGVIRSGANDFTLTFADASGKPVDVGAASINFHMPAMGSMAAMNDAATLTTTDTPGVYRGKVSLQMAGEWQAQIAYEGAAGKGKTSFPVSAQ